MSTPPPKSAATLQPNDSEWIKGLLGPDRLLVGVQRSDAKGTAVAGIRSSRSRWRAVTTDELGAAATESAAPVLESLDAILDLDLSAVASTAPRGVGLER